jgi:hypothetical protein
MAAGVEVERFIHHIRYIPSGPIVTYSLRIISAVQVHNMSTYSTLQLPIGTGNAYRRFAASIPPVSIGIPPRQHSWMLFTRWLTALHSCSTSHHLTLGDRASMTGCTAGVNLESSLTHGCLRQVSLSFIFIFLLYFLKEARSHIGNW